MDYNNSETDLYTELDKLRISGTETDIVTITKRFSNNYDIDLLESLLKDIDLYLFIERDIKESEFTNTDVDFAISELSKNGLQTPYKKRKSFDELTERQRQNRERMELKNITLPKQTIDLEKLLFPFEFYCIYQLKNKIEIAIKTKPKQETSFTSLIDFFNKVNQNLVSELDLVNFIEKTTNKEPEKLQLLAKDLESFEINFICDELVESWIGKEPHNPKSISDLYFRFKEMAFNLTKVSESQLINESQKIVESHSDTFSNNGFILFEYLLNNHIRKVGITGRFTDISDYYWKMYNSEIPYIHQKPEAFKRWFFKTYDNEDIGKIKTADNVKCVNRNKHYSSSLEWFKTQIK